MNNWVVLGAALAVVEGLCLAADRFVLNRHKARLYYFLLSIWVRLDDARIRDFHHVLARRTLQVIGRVARPRGRELLGSAVITGTSFLLTFSAIALGMVADEKVWVLWTLGFEGREVWRWPAVLGINLGFDFATVLVTVLILRKVARSGWFRSTFLILTDIITAAALAVACVVVVNAIGFFGSWEAHLTPSAVDELIQEYHQESTVLGLVENQEGWVKILEAGDDLVVDYVTGNEYRRIVFTRPFPDVVEVRHKVLAVSAMTAYAATTLIPTAVYLSVLFLVLLAKPILKMARMFTLYFIEKATEVNDPKKLMVFTMTGTLLNVIAVLVNLIHHLARLG